MTDTNPTERARLIAADTIGVSGSLREDYLSGVFDNGDHVRIALAALASQAAQPAEADGVEPGLYSRFHKMLLELLAVIHRDGGQKTQAIGLQLSYEQALELSSQRIAATPKAPATDVEADGCNCGIGDQSDIGHYHESWCAALATPPAPNDDLRAALERAGRNAEVKHGEVVLHASDWLAIQAALKENRRG